jgi:hypothetical protein
MADIRTSHTATPLRGFAAMPKAKHIEAATRGGKTRGAQQTRAAKKLAAVKREEDTAHRREVRRHRARTHGQCTQTLASALRSLAHSPLMIARRTRLDSYEISEARARMLQRRGLAKIRKLAHTMTAYITDLGREVVRDTR